VPENKLKEFEMNHLKDVQRCLIEAIKHWKKNEKVIKWEVLWVALCHSTVSHENLGREIRDWYREKTWRDPRRQVNCDNRLLSVHSSYMTSGGSR
jgi:hypothetical protein